jgi:hypothetical protein
MRPLFQRTVYSHGREFCSCTFCNKLLTLEEPGERVAIIMDGKRIVEHVCKECFDTDGYQECIKDLSNKYGMDIRSFPQMQD